MAWGGGTFQVQNKVLPGAYINFISKAKAKAELSDRGFATIALELDWGTDNEVFEVTNADFQKNSLKLFGYDYGHEKLRGLRDLFLNLNTLYAYRLNTGNKATNTYATARHSGIRGNDIKIIIQKDVDNQSLFYVKTLIGNILVDNQTVPDMTSLKDNDYVIWKKDGQLQETAGIPLANGTNSEVETANHQAYLDKIEAYTFNIIGVVTTTDTVKSLYVNFTKRMRDEVGAKFQLVVHNKKADYEGVINVKNPVNAENESALVYWVTGLEAACKVNKSCLNKLYNGEFELKADYTQAQLTQAVKQGEFTLHKVGSDIRVLEDINSLVTLTEEKREDFQDNQTIRVIDQIANDIAVIFNKKYLEILNNQAGRISLWTDIVNHHEKLQKIGAIEDFKDEDVTIEKGDTKKSVLIFLSVTPAGTMAQLYMLVRIS